MSQIPPSGKQAVADTENVIAEDGQSSESVMTALHSGSSQDNDDGSDVSLKLGWVGSCFVFYAGQVSPKTETF